MSEFKLKSLTEKGKLALIRFEKQSKGFLLRRILGVEILNHNPYTINIKLTAHQGTPVKKNKKNMEKARTIIQNHWITKATIDIDYEVE